MAEHKNVYEALAAAQAEFPAITHNCTNPHFRSTYADLGAILGAVSPVLRAHDLMVMQSVKCDESHTELLTELRHVPTSGGGGQINSTYPLPQQDDPQKLGSALTYARRYALSTILGIVTEKDDDGNGASASGQNTSSQRTQTQRQRRESSKSETPTASESKSAPAASSPETAADYPEGWFSREDCEQAHNAIVPRIQALPAEQQAEARKMRDVNSWPMKADAFKAFEQWVTLCESAEPSAS